MIIIELFFYYFLKDILSFFIFFLNIHVNNFKAPHFFRIEAIISIVICSFVQLQNCFISLMLCFPSDDILKSHNETINNNKLYSYPTFDKDDGQKNFVSLD